MSERKSFPLRISKQLYAELRQWSEDEMRSVNAQIEFILREAVKTRKKRTSHHKDNRSKNKSSEG